jgi:hypothetical protein
MPVKYKKYKQMKGKIAVFAIVFVMIASIGQTRAQNQLGKTDDLGRIVLNAYVSDQIEGLPASAKRMLSNKLSQIVTHSGMGGSAYNPRFIITPNITVLTKNMTATAPPMMALTVDITLYIGDGIAGIKYASTSWEAKGVGTNETKAYISALKQINYRNPEIQSFVSEGKNRIIEYYNSKCDFIITSAKSNAERKEYDKALTSLLAVPEVCKECYDKSQQLTIVVYKLKMENECMEKIQASKVAKSNNNWDQSAALLNGILPDVSCYGEAQTILKEVEDHRCSVALGKARGAWSALNASDAGYWLGKISADSKCYAEAVALGEEIKRKLKDDSNRAWEYKLKQQQDKVDIEKETLKAARDVGVAYGNNQPQNVTYNVRGWW